MFTRRDSQASKSTLDTRAQPEVTLPPAPQPEPPASFSFVEPAPAPAVATPAPAVEVPPPNVSIVATGDVFEGKLTTVNGVRIQGTVRGTIESQSIIQVDADALVEADISAENVTIAGTYKGSLNCSGRLEITASGRANGELETGRILLHEGGFFEGTLHMKPNQPSTPASSESTRRRYGSGKE